MKEATVILQHKKKKNRKISVSMPEYATDLGKEKFRAYELAGDRHNGTGENKVEAKEVPTPTPEIKDEGEGEGDKFKELEDLNSEKPKSSSKKQAKKS